jgi:hypothetical protein
MNEIEIFGTFSGLMINRNKREGFLYFSVTETDTATSGLHWIFHMHSEFSRPAMCYNAIMIIDLETKKKCVLKIKCQ